MVHIGLGVGRREKQQSMEWAEGGLVVHYWWTSSQNRGCLYCKRPKSVVQQWGYFWVRLTHMAKSELFVLVEFSASYFLQAKVLVV